MNAARIIAIVALANSLQGCAENDIMIPEVPDFTIERVDGPNSAGCVSRMVLDDAGTIYLYTERYDRWHGGRHTFVLVSTDGGESWTEHALENSYSNMAVDGEGAVYLTENLGNSIRSADGAQSWTDVSGTLPADLTNWLPRLWSCIDGKVYLSTLWDGIYRYDPVEKAWTSMYDSLPWGESDLYSIAVDPAGRMYAGTSDGLWRTGEGGGWTRFDSPEQITDNVEKILIDGEGGIYLAFEYQTLDWWDEGLLFSKDDGGTWGDLFPGTRVRDFFVDRQDRLFVFTNIEAFMSTDGGYTFEETLKGQNFGYVAIESGPAGGIFLFSSEGPGLQRSTDGGGIWELIGFPYADTRFIFIDSEGALYSMTQGSGIWKMKYGEDRWSCFSIEGDLIHSMCMAESPEGDLVAGTSRGVFTSPIDAPSWSPLGGNSVGYVYDILHLGDGRIAARRYSDIYLFENTGGAWIEIGMKGYDLTSIAQFGGRLYASADFGGVFRYTGEGAVWEQVNAGLKDLRVTDMAVLPGAGLFAGTKAGGLFLLKEGTSAWQRYGTGGNLSVTALHATEEALYVGTDGEGIFWTCADAGILFECSMDASDPDIQDFTGLFMEDIISDPAGNLYILSYRRILRMKPAGIAGNSGDR